MSNSPVLIFTYKRLESLKRCIEGLLMNEECSETDVFIFSDAAKTEDDKFKVDEVRTYIQSINGFQTKFIVTRSENFGLARSIIEGTTHVISKYGKAIVLEDDLVPTRNFLRFMNKSLETFQNSKHVFSISGYSFDLKAPRDCNFDSYFLNRGWSWGWATWEDRWKEVDWTVKDYASFKTNRKLQRDFNRGGSDLTSMLNKQMSGKLDSWAIRWFYHQFKIKGVTLYPVKSKILNIGFDNEATHTTGSSKRYIPNLDSGSERQFNFPVAIEPHSYFQRQFQLKMGVLERIISKVSSCYLQIKRWLKF